MRFYRYERVASLIREKLSWILEREVEVEGVGLAVGLEATAAPLFQTSLFLLNTHVNFLPW